MLVSCHVSNYDYQAKAAKNFPTISENVTEIENILAIKKRCYDVFTDSMKFTLFRILL